MVSKIWEIVKARGGVWYIGIEFVSAINIIVCIAFYKKFIAEIC